jgi:hypothetical protein
VDSPPESKPWPKPDHGRDGRLPVGQWIHFPHSDELVVHLSRADHELPGNHRGLFRRPIDLLPSERLTIMFMGFISAGPVRRARGTIQAALKDRSGEAEIGTPVDELSGGLPDRPRSGVYVGGHCFSRTFEEVLPLPQYFLLHRLVYNNY